MQIKSFFDKSSAGMCKELVRRSATNSYRVMETVELKLVVILA